MLKYPADLAPSITQPKKVYPIAVKKGRPKFQLQSESQERTGPHRLPPNNKHQIPAPINKFLRKYQREGVEFLYRQYTQGIGGSEFDAEGFSMPSRSSSFAVLGDDMGLGKTIQVIAFLSAVMGRSTLSSLCVVTDSDDRLLSQAKRVTSNMTRRRGRRPSESCPAMLSFRNHRITEPLVSSCVQRLSCTIGHENFRR